MPTPAVKSQETIIPTVAVDEGGGSARKVDQNGFVSLEKCPISRAGVFPYLGSQIDPAGTDPTVEPGKIYMVLRSEEELSKPETLASFRRIPLIEEHEMLGKNGTPVEKRPPQGTLGDLVTFENGIMYSTMSIWSEVVKAALSAGKKQLSTGYQCDFVRAAGSYLGKLYDFAQKNILGNHIAVVQEGRMGPDIAVLDRRCVFDKLDITLKPSTDMENCMDPEEMKKKKDAEDKAAKDAAEAEEKKKAEDKATKDAAEEEEKKKKEAADKAAKDSEEEEKKKKEGMDAAISTAVDKAVAKALAGAAIDEKAMLERVSQRNALAARLEKRLGTFDHGTKTLAEVAAYGLDKCGLTAPKGAEQAVLDAYLTGLDKAKPLGGSALDAKPDTSKDLLEQNLAKFH